MKTRLFDRAVDKPGRGIIIQVVNNIIVRFLLIFCLNVKFVKDKKAFFSITVSVSSVGDPIFYGNWLIACCGTLFWVTIGNAKC